MESGFSRKFCTSAHMGGQNLLTWEGIYHHFRIEERTLNIPVAELLAYRGDWHACLQKLAGSTMA